jgi:uncharacterized membrane protein
MFTKASEFFTKDQQEQIRNAIKEAEGQTSGEIRVHIETYLTGDVMDRAAWIFKKIGMHATTERNGVLFYLAVRNKRFAIIGDAGINEKVPDGFWDNIRKKIEMNFSEGKFAEGLIEAILMAGRKLGEHFPGKAGDINELPDEISFDTPE